MVQSNISYNYRYFWNFAWNRNRSWNMMLPPIGEPEDETHGPWVYLAITSRGKEYRKQGLRIVVDANRRSKALSLGRSHHEKLTKKDDDDHFESTIVEDWAYSSTEAEYLQWETPQKQVVAEGDVTVIERKFKKK